MTSFFESYRDKSNDLYLFEGANFASPHFHHHIEILYVLEDGLEVTLNKQKYLLNQDETILFDSFETHGFDNPKGLRSISLVVPWKFNKDFFKKMANMRFENPVIQDPDCNRTILQLLRLLQDHTKNVYTKFTTITTYDFRMQPFLNEIISALIHIIFYYVPRVKETVGAQKKQFQQILLFIEENYRENITLEVLAHQIGYNPCYFSKLWRKIFNCGCIEYINSVRIEKLIEHYDNTESLTSLATAHGFNSLRSMERNFKAKYHVSPKEFFQ